MNNHPLRLGNFTSSENYRLMSNGTREMTPEEKAELKKLNPKSQKKLIEDTNVLGESANTYIRECNWERRLQRPLVNESWARPLTWGKLCELFVEGSDMFGLQYAQRSDEPIPHPEIDYWCGTPDMQYDETVCDLKCPHTAISFCTLVEPLIDGLEGTEAMNALRFGYTDKDGEVHKKHDSGECYYWQLVSNAVLTNSTFAELWIFCPYESQLDDIKMLAQKQPGKDIAKYYWIGNANNDELPSVPDKGFYKNLYCIRFEVPQSDKDALTDRVKLAGSHLFDSINLKAAA